MRPSTPTLLRGDPGHIQGRTLGTGGGGGRPHRRLGGDGGPGRGQCGWLRVDGGLSVCSPPWTLTDNERDLSRE